MFKRIITMVLITAFFLPPAVYGIPTYQNLAVSLGDEVRVLESGMSQKSNLNVIKDGAVGKSNTTEAIYSSSNTHSTAWAGYDLGGYYTVNNIVLSRGSTTASNYCTGFVVEMSTNPAFTLDTTVELARYQGTQGKAMPVSVALSFPSTSLRYIRFRGLDYTAPASYAHYSEFEVYGFIPQKDDVQIVGFYENGNIIDLVLRSNIDQPLESILIVAGYEEQRLSQVQCKEITLMPEEYYYDELSFSEPFDRVKVMVFDSFQTLVPLSVSKSDHQEHTEGLVDYSLIIENEANWIREQQITMEGHSSDGAIVMNKTHPAADGGKKVLSIEPYFATLACIGMLEHATEENIGAARKWMDWYFAHYNKTADVYGLVGTIYGYNINANDYTDYWSTEEYSASDSRGTSFLMLLKKYYEVTGDSQFLMDRKKEIEIIFDSAAVATMKEDGLTEAKNQDGHRTKYLQDNVLVCAALKDMVWLQEQVFCDTERYNYYNEIYQKSKNGIEGMWLSEENEYIYYKTPTRTRLTDWDVFYGDAVSQIFPTMYGLIEPDSDRAIQLYEKFNRHHPERVNRILKNEFPWMSTAIVSALMDDEARLNEQLYNMKETYMDSGRLWTWYIYESASTIKAAKIMRDKRNLSYQKPLDNPNLAVINDGDLTTSCPLDFVVVDFEEATKFNRVVVKAEDEIANQFKVSYSDDGDLYTAVANVKSISSYGDKMFDEVTARYMKITFAQTVNVRELETYLYQSLKE